MTTSFLGGPLDSGPCNATLGTASGETEVGLGEFENVTLKFGSEKTDLFTAQGGTTAQDAVVSGSFCDVEISLAQATLERMSATVQGFETNSLSGSIVGFSFGPAIGERDSSIQQQLTLVRVIDSIESTDPLDTIDIWKFVFNANIEMTFDAATQRFVGLAGRAYRSSTHLSPTGRPTFFGSAQYTS